MAAHHSELIAQVGRTVDEDRLRVAERQRLARTARRARGRHLARPRQTPAFRVRRVLASVRVLWELAHRQRRVRGA
jgi:hypothetical protein